MEREDLFQRRIGDAGDAKRDFQRKGIFRIFDSDDSLPGHTDPFGQLLLRQLIVDKTQGAT